MQPSVNTYITDMTKNSKYIVVQTATIYNLYVTIIQEFHLKGHRRLDSSSSGRAATL